MPNPPFQKSRTQIFSHHWEEDQDLTINRVCDSDHFDEASARDLVLAAGQISFHDVYIIHGSRANPSGRRRAALVGRFMPGHCHYDHELGLRLAEPQGFEALTVPPPLSVGEMTLRLYAALNYSQNSAHDLRRALNGA